MNLTEMYEFVLKRDRRNKLSPQQLKDLEESFLEVCSANIQIKNYLTGMLKDTMNVFENLCLMEQTGQITLGSIDAINAMDTLKHMVTLHKGKFGA